MSSSDAFEPPFWAKSAWLQTVGAHLWPVQELRVSGFEPSVHKVPLQDSDALAVTLHQLRQRPQTPKPMVVLVHGLCGDQDSSYIQRATLALMQQGHEVCRVNMRGCGPGLKLARAPYHAGRSEDLKSVFFWLRERCEEPLLLVGYSLGANIVLKYLAETGERCPVHKAMTISAPIDLQASAKALAQTPFGAMDRYFVRLLIEHVQRLHQAQPSLGKAPSFPPKVTVQDFDEIYTAPRSGFSSASAYYKAASSVNMLDKIRVPTQLVWSKDDPLIDHSAWTSAPAQASNPALEFLPQRSGGHVGFMYPHRSGAARFWLSQHIAGWAGALA